jgi:hypothetical protein
VIACGKILVRLLFLLSLLSLLVGGAIPAAAGSAAPPGPGPPDLGARARRLTSDLKKHGFEVSAGEFLLYRVADCPYSFAVMGTCYFNNPAAPYVLPVVPF